MEAVCTSPSVATNFPLWKAEVFTRLLRSNLSQTGGHSQLPCATKPPINKPRRQEIRLLSRWSQIQVKNLVFPSDSTPGKARVFRLSLWLETGQEAREGLPTAGPSFYRCGTGMGEGSSVRFGREIPDPRVLVAP